MSTSAPWRLYRRKRGRYRHKLEKLVSTHKEEEWLIAVDLQCGSPWNAAAGLAMRNPQLRVISGLSLPLALELVDNQQTLNAEALCQHLRPSPASAAWSGGSRKPLRRISDEHYARPY
jgi:mannose/fructose-specific phosphotransferase system component IIA